MPANATDRLEALLTDLRAAVNAVEHLDDELRLLAKNAPRPSVRAAYAREGLDQARKGLAVTLHAAALVEWGAQHPQESPA